MKHTRWLSFLLAAALLLLPAASFAMTLGGIGADEYYQQGMSYFHMEDYAAAASSFQQAGNYLDAKKWTYYCQAIDGVVNSTDANALSRAAARFGLLEAHSFEQSAQWTIYCKARSYESMGIKDTAARHYEQILVHDSIERYLACVGMEQLTESAEEVRSRVDTGGMSAAELYETAMAYYYFEEYATAADYFCLAGNYSDARQWGYYCRAISLVKDGKPLENTAQLFSILNTQQFADADQWLTYCQARYREEKGMYSQAAEMYRQIFINDSSERYLSCLDKLEQQ